jgi:hypothetical protein
MKAIATHLGHPPWRYPVVNRLGQKSFFDLLKPGPAYEQAVLNKEAEFRARVDGGRELDPIAQQNLDLAYETWWSFPFPPPHGIFRDKWGEKAAGELTEVVFSGRLLIEEELRAMIAVSALDHYNEIMEELRQYMEERQEDRERRMRIQATLMTVVRTVISVFVPVLGLVISAGLKAVSDKQRRDAAEALGKAAEQFEDEDAAFAEELRQAADILERQADQAEAAAERIPAGAETAGIPTWALVGGGIAAVGLVTLILS